MKYQVLRRVLIDGKYHEVGSTVEVSNEAAERLVGRGTLVKAPEADREEAKPIVGKAQAKKLTGKKK